MDIPSDCNKLSCSVNKVLEPFGFECHPFLTGWYNQLVSEKFQLRHPPSTAAVVVISQPSMFEKAFLPFLQEEFDPTQIRDPIDQCMLFYFQKVKKYFSELEIEVESLHDFQLDSRRRPRILVQTAGHVSGAVRFYKPNELEIEQKNNNFYPVCHHPRWGGWFALRGVFIFPQVQDSSLVKIEPPQNLSGPDASSMIELYNLHWQDWRWRDIGNPESRYSEDQIKYFETPPPERFQLIKKYLDNREL